MEQSWHLAKPPGESLLSHRAGRSCWEAVSRCVMTRLAGSDLGRQGAIIPGLKCSQDLWVNISAYVRCAGRLLMALRVRTWLARKKRLKEERFGVRRRLAPEAWPWCWLKGTSRIPSVPGVALQPFPVCPAQRPLLRLPIGVAVEMGGPRLMGQGSDTKWVGAGLFSPAATWAPVSTSVGLGV